MDCRGSPLKAQVQDWESYPIKRYYGLQFTELWFVQVPTLITNEAMSFPPPKKNIAGPLSCLSWRIRCSWWWHRLCDTSRNHNCQAMRNNSSSRTCEMNWWGLQHPRLFQKLSLGGVSSSCLFLLRAEHFGWVVKCAVGKMSMLPRGPFYCLKVYVCLESVEIS